MTPTAPETSITWKRDHASRILMRAIWMTLTRQVVGVPPAVVMMVAVVVLAMAKLLRL